MKKMIIFEPAMCCSTGVCGPGVDPELLRISTVLSNLKNKGVVIERYNLSNNPQVFIDNQVINEIITAQGVEALPATLVDGVVVKTKTYPSNEEICELLEVSEDYLKATATVKARSKGCGCKSGCC